MDLGQVRALASNLAKDRAKGRSGAPVAVAIGGDKSDIDGSTHDVHADAAGL